MTFATIYSYNLQATLIPFLPFALYVYRINSSGMHIGRNISRIRELLGIKQETLAGMMKVSQQTVSKIEQTEYHNDRTIERIAQALDVSPKTILNYDETVILRYLKGMTMNLNSPLSDTIQLVDKIIELYERLLNTEHEIHILYKKCEPSEPMERSGIGAS